MTAPDHAAVLPEKAPADIVEYGVRHGIPHFAAEIWEAAFRRGRSYGYHEVFPKWLEASNREAEREGERDAAQAEAFALAATQCATPVMSEHGHMGCSALQAALARAEKAEAWARASDECSARAAEDGLARAHALRAALARVRALEEGLRAVVDAVMSDAMPAPWPVVLVEPINHACALLAQPGPETTDGKEATK